MEPASHSYYFSRNDNYSLLNNVLSTIRGVQENQQETNNKICTCCLAVIQDLKEMPLDPIAGYFLVRSMQKFMVAGVEGLKEGKAAIRKCYQILERLLPDYENSKVDLNDFTVQILSESYLNPDVSEFVQLFHKCNQNKTIPSDVFAYLVHFDRLDALMKKMLFEVLSKSMTPINTYFLLLCKSLGLQNDLGLTHRHLQYPSEDDTVGSSDEESVDLEVVIDYRLELEILKILCQELDGGYSLLKNAEFLSLGNVCDLLRAIEIFKDKRITPQFENPLISTFLKINPNDRMEVLMYALEIHNVWEINFIERALFKIDLLNGIAAIPPECRENVLSLIPTYHSYQALSHILQPVFFKSGINGFIVAYLLSSYLKSNTELMPDQWRKVLTSILWEKFLDHSLPVFTLTSLACFVQNIDLPGTHPIRLLGNIMRTSGTIEPERTYVIHKKLEAQFYHLSTFRCPLNDVFPLNKRKIEDLDSGEEPVMKKTHLSS